MAIHEDRPIKELFTELTREVTILFRQEMALAKSEIAEDVHQIGSGIASLGAGGVIALAGLIILLQSAVIGLSKVVEPWLAALIVGGIVLVIGIAFAMKGRSNIKFQNLIPKRTMKSFHQDKQLVEEHM